MKITFIKLKSYKKINKIIKISKYCIKILYLQILKDV